MEKFRDKMKENCNYLPRMVFYYLGVCVTPHKSFLYTIYSTYMISLLILYPWSNLHLCLHNLDNFDIVIDSLFNTIGGFAASLKIAIILYRRKKFALLFEKLDQLNKYNTEEWSKAEVLSTNKKILSMVVYLYSALLYFSVSTMITRILNNDHPEKWTIPISDITVIDRDYSPNYEIAWALQSCAVTIASSAYCLIGFWFGAIIVDLTIQFKLLRKQIQRTFQFLDNSNMEDNNVSWLSLQRMVKQSVVHHLSLIGITDEVEDICSIVIFIGVVADLSVTSFSLYYASVLPPLDFRALQAYLEVSGIIIALFFLCYCGTSLSEATESIATACYEINFVGTDVRFQKSLQMIIMRCQKPITITVGKFGALSIAIFAFILRSIYTYFMVLRKSKQLQENSL